MVDTFLLVSMMEGDALRQAEAVALEHALFHGNEAVRYMKKHDEATSGRAQWAKQARYNATLAARKVYAARRIRRLIELGKG